AMRAVDEPALRTDEDQRLRAHVRARAGAWRCQSWAGLPGFRLARRDSRCRGACANGRLEPISAVAWPHAAAPGGGGSLQPPLRPAARTRTGLRDERR